MSQPRRLPSHRDFQIRQGAGHSVPSPLVGEGQGGGESLTSKLVVPPTPNPPPQGGGELRRSRGGAGLTRRSAVLGLGASALAPLAALGLCDRAYAQEGLRGTQREGTIAPIPIAIPVFLGEDERFVSEMTGVVT